MQGTLLFLKSLEYLYYIFPMSSTDVIPRVANLFQVDRQFLNSEASIFVEYNWYQYKKFKNVSYIELIILSNILRSSEYQRGYNCPKICTRMGYVWRIRVLVLL